ncbi:hypothetical protein [Lapidilactobacillus bayanensis]|uniref:hypothetical protein n=1 Tax=Lapidilactobacillus bayanensis TaxID=2485998 RepID=UPI001CDB8C52|nr:hypothetical protein [Lapidilactobacillus bayanensis]
MKKKHQVTRQEVSRRLVSDQYFESGHWILTIWQSILAVLAWLVVILPFVWLALPFVMPEWAVHLNFRTYFEELFTFKFLHWFLLIAVGLVTIFSVSLTIRNNHRFKHLISKEVLHDETRLVVRRRVLGDFYDERFGVQEFRESVRFYSIKAVQNLEVSTVKDLYQKYEVAL